MSYAKTHLAETAAILKLMDCDAIERMAAVLAGIKAAAGRVFFLGVGGSAANCSHGVNDFLKLVCIECYALSENVVRVAGSAPAASGFRYRRSAG